ncbi:MAG: hypothetical protein ACTSXG_02910 [Alphaproteobacteria bacterium]
MSIWKQSCFIATSLFCFAILANKNETPFSLMLKEKERKQLPAIWKKNNNKGCIFLSAILFFDYDKWTIWINGQMMSKENIRLEKVFIKNIFPDYIVICDKKNKKRCINLGIGQSLIYKSWVVVAHDACGQ